MRTKDDILGQLDRIRHTIHGDYDLTPLILLSLLEVIIDLRDDNQEFTQYLKDEMIERRR